MAWMTAYAHAGVRISGPTEERFGQQLAFRASELQARESFTVNLAPRASPGGNCCGIDVAEARTDKRGVAVLRFRWPAHYLNGSENVRWRTGERADVIVFGDAGRATKTARVRPKDS